MVTPVGKNPLYELERDIKMCTRCPLAGYRTNAVPGVGSANASIFLIGEAPGQPEDREGEPFVGNAGRKLNEWLRAAGIDRGHIYISNLLKCRPEDNKFPEGARGSTPLPVEKCRPFLHEQLKIVNPFVILLAGKQALQHVLLPGTAEMASPFEQWVGRVCRRRDLFGEARIGVMFHPAYVLRSKNPREEALCVQLLKTIKTYAAAKLLGEPAPLLDLHEIRPVAPPTFQQKLRLFGEPNG